jgi:hypothetical protein
LDRIDRVITDKGADPAMLDALIKAGVRQIDLVDT